MKIPKITIDNKNNMAYIKFSNSPVHISEEKEDGNIVIDFDINNKIVGIEVMSIKKLVQDLGERDVKIRNFSPQNIPIYLLPHLSSHYCSHN